MPQIIACGSCKTQMQVSDDAAGKQFRCPACKTIFTVPATVRQPVGAASRAAPEPPQAGLGSPGLPPPSRPAVPQVSKPAAPPPVAHAPGSPAGASHCPACGSDLLPG